MAGSGEVLGLKASKGMAVISSYGRAKIVGVSLVDLAI